MLNRLKLIFGKRAGAGAPAEGEEADAGPILRLIPGEADRAQVSSDRPTASLEDDRFGLADSFVPRLARIAIEWPRDDGLVVGMYGPWGVGKTSALNMFRDYVGRDGPRYPNTYVCAFNPWLYDDTGALITSFFATIAAELGKDMKKPWSRAADALRAMGAFLAVASKGVSVFGLSVNAEAIAEAARVGSGVLKDGAELTGEMAGFAEIARGGQSTLEQHRAVVERGLRQLGRSGGRIVVLVDDVDRLSREELLSLLRLVRIAGDLPFVTLILAVDDDRIRGVLESAAQEGYGKAYLDKIIQVGIHLPLPTRDVLQQKLLDQLEEMFETPELEFPEELRPSREFGRRGLFESLLDCFQTPRDLARYVNSLSVLLLSGKEKTDVHPADAALLEALHVFHPDVYDRVRRRRRFLTHRVDAEQYRKRGMSLEKVRRQREAELSALLHGGPEPTLEPRAERIVREMLHHLFGELVDPERFATAPDDAILRRIRSHVAFDTYFRFTNTELLAHQIVKEMLEDLVACAEVETSEAMAEKIVGELSDHDGAIVERIIDDLGFLLKKLSADAVRRFGSAVTAAAPLLDGAVALPLAVAALEAQRHVGELQRRRSPLDGSAEAPAETLYWWTHALVSRELCRSDGIRLLRHEKALSWISQAQRDGLLLLWLQGLDEDLRDGYLAHGADIKRIAELFSAARTVVVELEDRSPLTCRELALHLTRLVNRRPKMLGDVLRSVACTACDPPVLVCDKHQGITQALERLSAAFGDPHSLRPAMSTLREATHPIGVGKQFLDDLDKLLNLAPAAD